MKRIFPVMTAVLTTISPAIAADTLKVTVLGSSTIWGNGLLDELSLVGEIDNSLRDELSRTVYPETMRFSSQPEQITNRKLFRGKASVLKGLGSTVEFEHEGDELAICQLVRRTADYAEIGVYADGQKVASFDNRNPEIGEDVKNFTANGKTKLFSLGRPFTYNHKITVNGTELKGKIYDLNYVTGDVSSRFPGLNYVIVRVAPNGKVEHFIYFFQPPPEDAAVSCSFSYGNTIAYTACTVGGTADENQLESCYGIGNVPFDLANPTGFSSGLDFRYSNPRSFFRHRFPTTAKRKIILKIEGGVNPYFAINFATDRPHEIQNSGIGGFTAKRFLTDPYHRQVSDSLAVFVPDIAFIVLGGNDDWDELRRLVSRRITGLTRQEVENMHSMQLAAVEPQPDGKFTIVRNSGIIDAITPNSLSSSHLAGAPVVPGCLVRIGNYYGDNTSTAVRVIRKFEPEVNRISWDEPLDPAAITGIEKIDDLTGAEFSVRELNGYSANIAGMVDILRQANPKMKIILLNTYVPNYFLREVWGYAEALSAVAARYQDCYAADVTPAINAWTKSEITGKHFHEFKSTGATSYELPWQKHWQGFSVLVDGVERYGHGCHITSGWYYVPQELTPGQWKTARTKNSKIIPMQLVFTADPPPAGSTIRVIKADRVWSRDFAHPTAAACKVIGQVAVEAIRRNCLE